MKKINQISIIFLLVLLISSCTKDWTCSCQGKAAGNDIQTDFEIGDTKKGDAQLICDDEEFNYGADNYSECELN